MRFLSLVWRELHDQVRSVRFLAMAGTAAILSLFAVQAGSVEWSVRRHNADELAAQRGMERGKGGGHLAGQIMEPALRAIRFPNPLSSYVRGNDAVLPAYWDFSPARVQPGPSAVAAGVFSQSGLTLDLDFLIRVVLGLLAVLIGRDSLARERDTGTLHALLSQPLPSWVVLASKVVATTLALVVALSLVGAGAFIGTAAWLPDLLSADLAAFLAGTIAVGLLYLLVLLLAGFALAATIRSSVTVASISIVLWIYVALIVPVLIPLVGMVMTRPIHTIEAQLQSTYEREARTTQDLMGDYFESTLPPGADTRKFTEFDEPTAKRLDAFWHFRTMVLRGVLEVYEKDTLAAVQHQRRIVHLLTIASPASQFTEGLSAMAGTGTSLRTRWESATQQQQRILNARLFDDRPRVSVYVRSGEGRMILSLSRHPAPLVSSLPGVDVPVLGIAARARDALPNAGILAAYAGVLLLWTFVAFTRKPI